MKTPPGRMWGKNTLKFYLGRQTVSLKASTGGDVTGNGRDNGRNMRDRQKQEWAESLGKIEGKKPTN